MRILVTGGLGFLGRAVVATLSEAGHQVYAFSRRQADVRDREGLIAALAPLDLDAVCHLAALTSVRDSFADPVGSFEVNLGGTINLLRAVEGRAPRIVYASTSAVYGSGHSGRLSEDLVPQPENPYAASKLAAEQLLAYHPDAVILRCFNIAGAVAGHGDPNPTRIISAALRAAAGEIPHVTLNGDGSAVREFTHVLDVAEAFRLAIDAQLPDDRRILNIGTGDGVAMRTVIEMTGKVTGRMIQVVRRPAAREAHTLIADARRAHDLLGWRPSRSALDVVIRDAWQALVR